MQSLTEIYHKPLMPARIELWKKRRIIHLTWNEVTFAVDHITYKISMDNFQPDVIIGIGRGGLIPAAMLSHRLDVRNLEVVQARYYDKGFYPQRLTCNPIVGETTFRKHYHVGLLVDDIAGTGDTICGVKSQLKAKINTLRTATLVKNRNCEIDVDYYTLTVNDFVVFPWENSSRQLRLQSPTQKSIS